MLFCFFMVSSHAAFAKADKLGLIMSSHSAVTCEGHSPLM